MPVSAPGDYLSLDETLYHMRTLLFKSVNAERYLYTFISSSYSGKPTEEGGKYYIQGTEAIFHYLI